MPTQTGIGVGSITFHRRGPISGQHTNVCLPYVKIQKFVFINLLGNSASHLIEMIMA